jgi:pyruvate dehydrogenase E1 component
MPAGVEDGIVRGLYRFAGPPEGVAGPRVQLLASGPMMRCALHAREVLAARWGVSAEVWSATSWQELSRDGRATARWNRLHPEAPPRVPYIAQALEGHDGPVVAVSDWVESLPSLAGRFLNRRFTALGTDGFGVSDTREALRRHFEVNAPNLIVTALSALAQDGRIDASVVAKALRDYDIDPEKVDPAHAL